MALPAVLPASIPSPGTSTWDIGPFELRAYALCIMAGIVLAIWLGNKRWLARGGEPGVVPDIAVWAVPFGIVGGRLYHVVTDYQLYFGEGRDPWEALQIWEGGLGIWGAIAFGAVGVWIGCRRRGVPLPAMADATAPGILLAQAVGRWGNWFNQELFGEPTDLPWALEIDPGRRPVEYADSATFHPTFLYESLWAVFVALLLIWLDRRFRLGHGRVFALYVAGYTLGRGFWEYLRIDPANEILGLRVNMWVSGLVFLGAVAYVVVSARLRPGREDPETLRGYYEETDPFADASGDDTDDDGNAFEASDEETSRDEAGNDETGSDAVESGAGDGEPDTVAGRAGDADEADDQPDVADGRDRSDGRDAADAEADAAAEEAEGTDGPTADDPPASDAAETDSMRSRD
ncbi:prolipoprotein diacylglyceryl transferase [Haloactinopolyspora alba]|uniref:prolipoprotein diacylglyceryl transferase n=1 Tax=Haloactinopolyspora alba TaxID=648780 RepID=UPI00197A9BC5